MMSLYNNTGYSGGHHSSSLFGRVDLVALGLYFALVICGIVSITSASYDIDVENVFSLSNNYMKQIMWLGIASVVGVVILLCVMGFRFVNTGLKPSHGILAMVFIFILCLCIGG